MRTKFIAALVAAGGYGAFVSWAITADAYESKMKRNQKLLGDIISNRTRELDAAMLQLQSNKMAELGESIAVVEEDIDDGVTETIEEFVERIDDEPHPTFDEGETVEETRENLKNLISPYVVDPIDEEAFVHTALNSLEVDRNTPPFIISREVYAGHEDTEEGAGYDKLVATWYKREQLLLDDGDEEIKDIVGTVGWKALSNFGAESGDPNVVYVRNHRMNTDFEVILEEDSMPPAHVRYGMEKDEYEANKAAGTLRFRPED